MNLKGLLGVRHVIVDAALTAYRNQIDQVVHDMFRDHPCLTKVMLHEYYGNMSLDFFVSSTATNVTIRVIESDLSQLEDILAADSHVTFATFEGCYKVWTRSDFDDKT